MMRYPTPLLAAISSAATTHIHAMVMPMRRPVMIWGNAPGRMIFCTKAPRLSSSTRARST